jgi:spore coat polysaccharide biosynthesis predicted glycosyltransferase SpsG
MFVICIESSHNRGLGHLFRSLNLADELRRLGASVCFLINDHEPSCEKIKRQGFDFRTYPLDAPPGSWEREYLRSQPEVKVWVNDRLNMPTAHAEVIRAADLKLVTFDDRGVAAALADLNFSSLIFDGISQLHGQRIFTGPDYMILNPDICPYRRHRETLGSTLVSLGGADTHGATVKVAAHLKKAGIGATIVTGPAFSHFAELDLVIGGQQIFVHKSNVRSLAEEMSRHDLAITGGGLTPFEAAAAGLPTVIVANEDFEIPVGEALERLGCSRFAGHHASIDAKAITESLPISEMSRQALHSVKLDGIHRVAQIILDLEK